VIDFQVLAWPTAVFVAARREIRRSRPSIDLHLLLAVHLRSHLVFFNIMVQQVKMSFLGIRSKAKEAAEIAKL